jgi:hypothetical protein
MITRDIASLVIQSRTEPAGPLTAALGLTPSRVSEIGRRPHSNWIYETEVAIPPEDPESNRFASVRELLARIAPIGPQLRTLRPRYEYRIDWGGFSDSTQGGFVLPADVLAGLAALDCDLWGTVYLDERDEAGEVAVNG